MAHLPCVAFWHGARRGVYSLQAVFYPARRRRHFYQVRRGGGPAPARGKVQKKADVFAVLARVRGVYVRPRGDAHRAVFANFAQCGGGRTDLYAVRNALRRAGGGVRRIRVFGGTCCKNFKKSRQTPRAVLHLPPHPSRQNGGGKSVHRYGQPSQRRRRQSRRRGGARARAFPLVGGDFCGQHALRKIVRHHGKRNVGIYGVQN